MKTRKLLLIFTLSIIPFSVYSERVSLQSLQQQIDDLQQQIDAIPAVGEPKYEFIGFSTSFHGPQSGIVTLTKACQLDYPGSRICTTEEFIKTVNHPDVDSAEAGWIHTVLVPAGQSQTDYSGIYENSLTESLTCYGGGGPGTIVTGTGVFARTACNTSPERPVACCAKVK